MRVEVYWNLHRRCYSVRALEGPNKGRVAAHWNRVELTGVTFHVRAAGRERVLREGRKNVHAFVRGEMPAQVAPALESACVRYNPHDGDHFKDRQDGSRVDAADGAILYAISDPVSGETVPRIRAYGAHALLPVVASRKAS